MGWTKVALSTSCQRQTLWQPLGGVFNRINMGRRFPPHPLFFLWGFSVDRARSVLLGMLE
jgi:hypothetical protein